MPSSAATGAGSAGASGIDDPARGGEVGRQVDGRIGGHDRRGDHADSAGGTQCTGRPRQPLGASVAIGEDQDEPHRLVRGGKMPMQERLEIPVRRRDPRPFLDLEDEFAAGRAIRAGRDNHDRPGLRQPGRDGLGDPGPVDAGLDQVARG